MFGSIITLLPLLALSAHASKLQSPRTGQCIARSDAQVDIGPVKLVDCSSAEAVDFKIPAQGQEGRVAINNGSGRFVLSVDDTVQNGAAVWTSLVDVYGGANQKWTYDGQHFKVKGTHCLDESEEGKVQVWECAEWNTNQVWTLV